MNTVKIVRISKENAHHTQYYELEGEDDRTAIKIGTYQDGDTLIHTKRNQRVKNVWNYSAFERLRVKHLLVHEQRTIDKHPEHQEANQRTIDVTAPCLCGNISPVYVKEQHVWIADKDGAYQAQQQDVR
jgi:hypothetical protein